MYEFNYVKLGILLLILLCKGLIIYLFSSMILSRASQDHIHDDSNLKYNDVEHQKNL